MSPPIGDASGCSVPFRSPLPFVPPVVFLSDFYVKRSFDVGGVYMCGYMRKMEHNETHINLLTLNVPFESDLYCSFSSV